MRKEKRNLKIAVGFVVIVWILLAMQCNVLAAEKERTGTVTSWSKVRYGETLTTKDQHVGDVYAGDQVTLLGNPVKSPDNNGKRQYILYNGKKCYILAKNVKENESKKSKKTTSQKSNKKTSSQKSNKKTSTKKWKQVSKATTYAESTANAYHNIALACKTINGTTLKPNETFSWWEVVGQASKAKGYKPGKVFKNGVTTEYGGGVCKVSTTLNIAAKKAGISTNATPHSKRVPYAKKEDEATVYYGQINFSFKNTTGATIKIKAYADGPYSTVELYKAVK